MLYLGLFEDHASLTFEYLIVPLDWGTIKVADRANLLLSFDLKRRVLSNRSSLQTILFRGEVHADDCCLRNQEFTCERW